MSAPIYRVATLADVNGIAECSAEAMMEDSLFGALWPRRKEFPDQFVSYFASRARERILDHTVVSLISEIPVEENGKEVLKVVGIAQWQKFGKQTPETSWSVYKAAGSKLNGIQDWAYSWFKPKETASDPEAIAGFVKDFTEMEHKFWVKDGKDHDRWHLQFLAVHSMARRRGIGGRLVELGIERAKRDGCDASLEASPMGLPMYKSKGFEVLDTYMMNVKGPDGGPIPSPILMWKNPEVKR
ncbi:hypothetical protein TWF730_010658 [Orbilia blumenaviensis]|uniref:N-acetyltransferase domain-containing protein n=1 Tax=Orbilia blumenaviensis TaxID=1796055 RepID=A0AAV9UNX2_9PEZI